MQLPENLAESRERALFCTSHTSKRSCFRSPTMLPASSASCIPACNVRAVCQAEDAAAVEASLYKQLEATPERGTEFAAAVRAVLRDETSWCPSPPSHPTAYGLRCLASAPRLRLRKCVTSITSEALHETNAVPQQCVPPHSVDLKVRRFPASHLHPVAAVCRPVVRPALGTLHAAQLWPGAIAPANCAGPSTASLTMCDRVSDELLTTSLSSSRIVVLRGSSCLTMQRPSSVAEAAQRC